MGKTSLSCSFAFFEAVLRVEPCGCFGRSNSRAGARPNKIVGQRLLYREDPTSPCEANKASTQRGLRTSHARMPLECDFLVLQPLSPRRKLFDNSNLNPTAKLPTADGRKNPRFRTNYASRFTTRPHPAPQPHFECPQLRQVMQPSIITMSYWPQDGHALPRGASMLTTCA